MQFARKLRERSLSEITSLCHVLQNISKLNRNFSLFPVGHNIFALHPAQIYFGRGLVRKIPSSKRTRFTPAIAKLPVEGKFPEQNDPPSRFATSLADICPRTITHFSPTLSLHSVSALIWCDATPRISRDEKRERERETHSSRARVQESSTVDASRLRRRDADGARRHAA